MPLFQEKTGTARLTQENGNILWFQKNIDCLANQFHQVIHGFKLENVVMKLIHDHGMGMGMGFAL